MQKNLTVLIFCIFINLNFSQSPKEQLKLANAGTIETSNFYKEIPFNDKFGYFIIPITIGNHTYDYIFDTGGYNTLTSEIMNKNNIPSLMEVEVGSSNQIKSKIALTKIPSVNIAGINFKDVGAFNFDFDESPQIKCYTNGGLIGKSIIKNAIWQINSQTEKIIVTDNIKKLNHLDNAIRLKVKFVYP